MNHFNIENFGFPEWAYLGYAALYLWAAWYMHNKPKKGNWNFLNEFCNVSTFFVILYFGGFFK